MYRPLIVTQKVATDIRFLQTETLFAPFSIHFHRGRHVETARDSRDKQSGKSRVKKAAYGACRTARRSILAKLVDKHSEIDGVVAINAGDAGLASTDPAPSRLRAFAYSAARAFERTQARSRFSFGAGGLAFLDLEIQCDNRSR